VLILAITATIKVVVVISVGYLFQTTSQPFTQGPDVRGHTLSVGMTVNRSSATQRLESHRATVYSGPCDGQSNVMADGTHINPDGSLEHNGKHVSSFALASSFLRLGTHVHFTRRVFGNKNWTVRDTGGEFDLYRPNCNYSGWPGLTNPTLYFTYR
jgi:3D (Asp-Asp-Asp) domain-containing protein